MTPKRHLEINWPLDSNTFWPENLTFHLFFVENNFYIKRSLILAFIFRSSIHSITIYPKCQIKFVSKCLLLKFTEWPWVPPAGFAIWLVKQLELNTRWSTVIWWMEETRLQNISRWLTFIGFTNYFCLLLSIIICTTTCTYFSSSIIKLPE